jgi:hypothetical protein
MGPGWVSMFQKSFPKSLTWNLKKKSEFFSSSVKSTGLPPALAVLITWIYRHDVNDSFWENRHRYYLQLTGKVDIGRLSISLREKFQSTYIDKDVKGFDYSPENYLRSKLQIAWDIQNSKLEPYASAEMISQLNNPDGNEIDNMRYTLGVEFPLAKKLVMDTYLRLSQEMNVKNPVNLYLIGINLNLNL